MEKDDAQAAEIAALKDKLEATEAKLNDAATTALAAVPEHLKALIPDMAPAEKLAWFHAAKATGVFDKPAVPATDSGTKPTVTPVAPDATSLPIYARMAGGYRKYENIRGN